MAELASAARVSKLTIVNIEAERAVPRSDTILRLADALHVPFAQLKAHQPS